jgi:hypothetical protein
MEINKTKAMTTISIYSDQCKNSQYFIPKMWIKWRGEERRIKLKTLLGDIISVSEDQLRKMRLKMGKYWNGKKYVRIMEYNKPYRQNNAIPLLAISKKLQKRIGRLSINVEREYEQRSRNYPSWTGAKVT